MSGSVKDDTTRTKTSQELPQSSTVSDYKGPKLRVGVVNFQNKTPSRVLGIGEAAADILGTILQRTDRFIVIPQQDIASILAQQRMGATGAINPETAAEMGKILGLNAIVTGAVTAYSEAEEGSDFIVGREQNADRAGYRRLPYCRHDDGRPAHGGFRGRRISKKGHDRARAGSKASYDSDLRDGALRDALNKAMVNMMQKLGASKWTGRIAQVDGDNLYINAGQKSGLNVGDKLDVFRPGKDIIDPVTKMKLGTTESRIGQAIVQQNDIGDSADLSIAMPTSGTGFKPGDIVKLGTK